MVDGGHATPVSLLTVGLASEAALHGPQPYLSLFTFYLSLLPRRLIATASSTKLIPLRHGDWHRELRNKCRFTKN
jgi:hypothetical protein